MNKSADFLMLSSGSNFGERRNDELCDQGDFAFVDVYDLMVCDLDSYICLVINGLVDQEFLFKEKERIRAFLDQGKIVLFGGHLFRPWLPGSSMFVPKTIRSHNDYAVSVHTPHPIFEGVLMEDLTFRKGVSGFFARGHHPVPLGVEILLKLSGGEPILYIDRQSTKGTIIVHAGNDLFSYHDRDNTSSRIRSQLIEWIRGEYRELQEGVVHP